MNYWIFRCNPAKYRIDDRLAFPEPRITWRVSRYSAGIAPGDIAFIWRGGNTPGICAVIAIDSYPQKMAELDHEKPFCTTLPTDTEVRVTALLKYPIVFLPKTSIEADPQLADLSVLHFTQATNYRVTTGEGRRLEEHLKLIEQTTVELRRTSR
jgi:hypothetical protein